MAREVKKLPMRHKRHRRTPISYAKTPKPNRKRRKYRKLTYISRMPMQFRHTKRSKVKRAEPVTSVYKPNRKRSRPIRAMEAHSFYKPRRNTKADPGTVVLIMLLAALCVGLAYLIMRLVGVM